LNLGNPDLSDEDLLAAIEANPILLNRPIVVTEKGTRLARPLEVVQEIL
jgi:arsenate reductase